MDLAKLGKKAFLPTPGQYRTNVFSKKLKRELGTYIDQVLLLKICQK
jgi:hypothetical protein